MILGFFSEMANIEGSAMHMVRQMRWLVGNGHQAVMFSSGGALEPELADLGIPHVKIDSVLPRYEVTPEQLLRDGAVLRDAVQHYKLQALFTAPRWPFTVASAAAGDIVPVYLQILSPTFMVPQTDGTAEYMRQAATAGRVQGYAYDDVVPHAKHFGFDPSLAKIKWLPMDTRVATPKRERGVIRAELGAEPDEIIVISVTRLDEDRAPFVLPLSAGVATLRKAGMKIRLVIVGYGTEEATLRKKASEGTTFLGLRRDLADLYAAADVYCGEGSAMTEAAVAGLPVIVTCALTQPAYAKYAYGIFGLHIVEQWFWKSTNVCPPQTFEAALEPFARDASYRRRFAVRAQEIIKQADIDAHMNWLLSLVRGEDPPSMHVQEALAIIDSEGGDSDEVTHVALALEQDARFERIALAPRNGIPWLRLASLPQHLSDRLVYASRLQISQTLPRISISNGRVSTPGDFELGNLFGRAFARVAS